MTQVSNVGSAMLQPILPDSEYEIHPCIEYVDVNGKTYAEQCEEDDPNIKYWGLYLHLVEQKTSERHIIGGLDWIEDFSTKEDAEKAQKLLERFAKGEFSSKNCPVCSSENIIEDDGADDLTAKGLQICMACGRSWWPHDRSMIFV